jgi:hypothetical protein
MDRYILNKNCIEIIFSYLNECKLKNEKYTEIYLVSKYWNNFCKLKFKKCNLQTYCNIQLCNTHIKKNYFLNNNSFYNDPFIYFLNYL